MIRPEKTFEFPILAKKSVSISVKTFFFWRPSVFGRKKRLNFRAFREISSQFWDKPCETDSRTMNIRVKVVCTFLSLSKKPPFSKSWLRACPSVIRLNKLVYLLKSTNFDIFICNFWFKPSPFRKLSVTCQTRPRLLIFHSTISLSHKNSSLENF